MDYWKIQDVFHQRMKMDYERGLITNPIFKPYYEGKFYGASINSITKEMCYTIMKEAQRELDILDNRHPRGFEQLLETPTLDDVWKQYKGYGKDCYLYSYLIGIECEITKIMMIK